MARRMTTQEAADALGLTVDAMRSRIRRGNIQSEKDPDGRVYVWLTDDESMHKPKSEVEARQELVEELRDRVRSLEHQLEAERQAHAEARRIIAVLASRVPQLEAPPESPVTASEPVREASGGGSEDRPSEGRSWWRRVLGR